MKKERLLDAFGQIDEEFVEEADPEKKKKAKKKLNKNTWVKLGVMAACLCLAVGVLVPMVNGLFNAKGGGDFQDGVPAEPALIYFQGALYQCCYAEDALKRVGLPSEITADLAGEHVAYLEMGGAVDYQETIKETDKELFQYALAPTRAVYILRDGDNYMAALFCRTYFPDEPNAYSDLAEVYRFFDISDGSDIVSIAQTDWNRGKVTGAEITEPSAIEEFYTLTTDITKFVSMDNDAFQSIVFDGIPEEEQQEAHNAFADDLQIIRVETKDGFRFYLQYYPNYGFLECTHAMAYHTVTPELKLWFETNMDIK